MKDFERGSTRDDGVAAGCHFLQRASFTINMAGNRYEFKVNHRNMSDKKLPYLNLGCGSRFHSAWTNADLESSDNVMSLDIRRPLPFPDGSFEAVYHSHVLEHLAPAEGRQFMAECYRVTRPGGTLRVAVPDLEGIVRHYLESLEQALRGEPLGEANHTWMVLELYDQAVREAPGGSMRQYLEDPRMTNRNFVIERLGEEARRIVEPKPRGKRSGRRWNLQRTWRRVMRQAANVWSRFILSPVRYRALQKGLFRDSGEIHRWMYDRFSLARLLERSGYEAVACATARTSRIPNWNDFELDSNAEKVVFKPDSLFVEGTRSVGS
jgi:SAM-dependent methyltransferase